jgi:hypothetical protein
MFRHYNSLMREIHDNKFFHCFVSKITFAITNLLSDICTFNENYFLNFIYDSIYDVTFVVLIF